MKKIYLGFTLLTCGLFATACSGNKEKATETDSTALEAAAPSDTATVYYIKDITPENLVKIYEALGVPVPEGAKVAVKISTGESKDSYNLEAGLIKALVQKVDGTLVESNTAYPGNRNTTEAHRKAIAERGYMDVADFDILDAEGSTKIPVRDTTWIHYDIVGDHLPNYNYMINLAHFKGHAMGGFGGVLKNASIGIASSEGKAYIHSAGRNEDVDKFWDYVDNQDGFLEAMASAAQGIHDFYKQPGKNIVYIDVLNNMSVDCDCNGHPEKPVLKDMGILASTDPVALDKAALDLVFGHENVEGDDAGPIIERIKEKHGTHIIEHAEKIGLGTTNYKLITLD